MKIVKILSNRIFMFAVALLAQIAAIVAVSEFFTAAGPAINGAIRILSLVIVCFVINEQLNTSIKLTWIVFILAVPVLGSVFYLLTGGKKPRKWLSNAIETAEKRNEKYKIEDCDAEKRLCEQNENVFIQSRYLKNAGFNLMGKTDAEYFSSGEKAFPVMLRELEKAEKFIFMEYFILDKGEMLSKIEEVLERKAKAGVDVRVIYDDFGCLFTRPEKYDKYLEEKGIKCISFNRVVPFLSAAMNNRDHRKILVIDSEVAFTGGINIADEYINKKKRFGYWKDNAVMLKGEGAKAYTAMFLNMWMTFRDKRENVSAFFEGDCVCTSAEGFVQPFCDSPLDDEPVSSNVYMNAINGAKKYIYIFTPYLIPNNEIYTALCLAAKKGVDVRITVPGIPDKKTVYVLTKSYFEPLLKAGVKIYVFSEGFVHSKGFVCDDSVALCGTVNLDYRSLHHHFECGAVFYNAPVVMQIKKDMTQTMERCEKAKIKVTNKPRGLVANTYGAILRLIAPLM